MAFQNNNSNKKDARNTRQNRQKQRENRAAEAKKHIALMDLAYKAETEEIIKNAQVFEQGEGRDLKLPEPQFEKTEIIVKRGDSVYSICNARADVVALDFASFLYPGGGYKDGAWAQEEALCAESNLYNVLIGLRKQFYDGNRNYIRGSLYTDRAMLLHDIRFSHGGNDVAADVVVIAAPNKRRALESHRSERECSAELARRVKAAMNIAASSGKPVAVLGAFGCGVFGNDPRAVAKLFKEWLDKNSGVFERVIFPIPAGPNLNAFDEVFGTSKPEPNQEQKEEEPEEEETLGIDIEQTSDGRWVFE